MVKVMYEHNLQYVNVWHVDFTKNTLAASSNESYLLWWGVACKTKDYNSGSTYRKESFKCCHINLTKTAGCDMHLNVTV